MRPVVIASKRGIEVRLRVILQIEANIPDLTSNLQEMIKTRIQDMLGIEEEITVKVHVAKIITYGDKKRDANDITEVMPPFRGHTKR